MIEQPLRGLRSAVLCCLLAAATGAGAAAPVNPAPPGQPTLTAITHTAPSPDGRRVAFVVSPAGAAEPGGQLRVVMADGTGGHGPATADGPAAAPRWSPDGRWLAYLAPTAGTRARLMIQPAEGGAARALADVDAGPATFEWAPDGTAIAFLRTAPAAPGPAPGGARVVGGEHGHRQLWLLTLDERGHGRESRRLTPEDLHVGSAFPPDATAFDWSPAGRDIAFTHTRSPAAEDWKTADISVVDTTTGRIRVLQQSNAAEFSPHYSPNGRRIAFQITLYPPSSLRQWRVGIAASDGTAPRLLAATADEQPRLLGWLGNRQVLVSEPLGTTTALWKLPVSGGPPRRFDDGDTVLSALALNASGSRLALVSMNDTLPPEVAITGLRRFRPAAVSRINAHWRALPTAATRRLHWRAADGQELEGLLTLPAGPRPEQRHPLVLLLHPAPAGAFTRGHPAYPDGLLTPAELAGHGYAVLRINARGASGYGYRFRAQGRDWGSAPFDDLMSGVDLAIENGFADPQRLAVLGWGHGALVAADVIARSHRFSAAVLGAPAADLMHLRATGSHGALLVDYLDGEFRQREPRYRALSPLLQAHRITTPVLILHGEADRRVPLTQGLALHDTLRRLGLDTRMVVYPAAPHHLRQPAQRRHAAGEALRWLARHAPAQLAETPEAASRRVPSRASDG